MFCDFTNKPIIGGTPPPPPPPPLSSEIRHERAEFPLNCSNLVNHTLVFEPKESSTNKTCPDYFRWIHRDLKQWKSSGITKDMIERGKPIADFRLVIVNGEAYVERYIRSFQTRDLFTIWGILQLLRLYPGKIPDLDLLFYCGDNTVIMKSDYKGRYAALAPPVFHYCGEEAALDIVFPDWSFWGWVEVNIKPWEEQLRAIKKERERIKTWSVSEKYILACDSMTLLVNPKYYDFFSRSMMPMQHFWPIRNENKCRDLKFAVEWGNNHTQKAEAIGKAGSKFIEEALTMQNVYDYMFHLLNEYSKLLKFKPTIPPNARRLCSETTEQGLLKEFMVQSMVKSPSDKLPCALRPPFKPQAIKASVKAKEKIARQAQAMGKAGSKFIEEILTMRNVYDYMFHLLNEYSKLLKFKPTIPSKAHRVCAESVACLQKGLWKDFMVQSMVKSPSHKLPCALPPPFEPQAIQASLDREDKITRQVETWETEYWKKTKP
ncbi:KDEL motif-containing 1 [Gossypium arboreum]|uniref:KDEL motif-containing 1 n=1 Tax=Gossypium arboreum TaxID=29729 RepID=A0A0B0MT07_GOSAR|nr:KDEL motif-containing 1 [Gossypium arboreum]